MKLVELTITGITAPELKAFRRILMLVATVVHAPLRPVESEPTKRVYDSHSEAGYVRVEIGDDTTIGKPTSNVVAIITIKPSDNKEKSVLKPKDRHADSMNRAALRKPIYSVLKDAGFHPEIDWDSTNPSSVKLIVPLQ